MICVINLAPFHHTHCNMEKFVYHGFVIIVTHSDKDQFRATFKRISRAIAICVLNIRYNRVSFIFCYIHFVVLIELDKVLFFCTNKYIDIRKKYVNRYKFYLHTLTILVII